MFYGNVERLIFTYEKNRIYLYDALPMLGHLRTEVLPTGFS